MSRFAVFWNFFTSQVPQMELLKTVAFAATWQRWYNFPTVQASIVMWLDWPMAWKPRFETKADHLEMPQKQTGFPLQVWEMDFRVLPEFWSIEINQEEIRSNMWMFKDKTFIFHVAKAVRIFQNDMDVWFWHVLNGICSTRAWQVLIQPLAPSTLSHFRHFFEVWIVLAFPIKMMPQNACWPKTALLKSYPDLAVFQAALHDARSTLKAAEVRRKQNELSKLELLDIWELNYVN